MGEKFAVADKSAMGAMNRPLHHNGFDRMQIIRWEKQEPPREEELWQRMRQEGLSPYTWSNGPGDTYAVHSHSYEKVLYCVRGSIRFTLPDARDGSGNTGAVDLVPGDCFILPAGIRHGALVGPQGVTCLEATRR